MTSSHPIDVERLLADQLASASPDLLRGLLSTFIAALMNAEADGLCGAGYGERSSQRSIGAMGIGTGISTPAPERLTWPFLSCAPAAISRTGC